VYIRFIAFFSAILVMYKLCHILCADLWYDTCTHYKHRTILVVIKLDGVNL